jgi:hypothetical protein
VGRGNPLLPRNCKSYERRSDATARNDWKKDFVNFGRNPKSKIQNPKSAGGKARQVGLKLKPGDLSVLP